MQLRVPAVSDAHSTAVHDTKSRQIYPTISILLIMFGIIKRNRPIIPTRLPEIMNAPIPEDEDKKPELVISPPALDDEPVAEKSENMETPPLTPLSEGTGEASTDEPSIEELTIEEICKILEMVDQQADKTNEGDASSDDIPDSEETDDESSPISRIGYKMISVWFFFWAVALAGGILAYYISKHQELIANSFAGDTTEELNLLLMPREKWDDSNQVVAKPTSYMAQRVVVLQTDTETCDTTTTCSRLLNAMKRKQGTLKYNFLLATDGYVYEALGWQEPSPLYPDKPTMVIAFIGNYETVAPSTMQLNQLQSLLETSELLKYLTDSYTILGRKQEVVPSKLFAYLSAFEMWDKQNSDTDEQYIDIDFDPIPIFDD